MAFESLNRFISMRIRNDKTTMMETVQKALDWLFNQKPKQQRCTGVHIMPKTTI